jgi:hypothetical protein
MDFMHRLGVDDELRARLKADPAGTLRAEGWNVPDEVDVEVLEWTQDKIYIGIPPRSQVDVELTDEQLGAAAGGACASATCSTAYCGPHC